MSDVLMSWIEKVFVGAGGVSRHGEEEEGRAFIQDGGRRDNNTARGEVAPKKAQFLGDILKNGTARRMAE